MAEYHPRFADMRFMDVDTLPIAGAECWVSRSGYTGEDGYEISIPVAAAETVARALLAHDDVEFIGLGARDSLRLEAGLCLYGHDIDTDTTPTSASLNWAIQKARRTEGARVGGFPGADVILSQIENGASHGRVGLRPTGRAPMREGVEIFANETSTDAVGKVTSGGFGPSVEAPVAMGYVTADLATVGTTLYGEVRGKRHPVEVSALPFVPANFKR
jgi:aminomethyltransferase